MQRNRKVLLMYRKTKAFSGRYVDVGPTKDKSYKYVKRIKEITSQDL